MDAANETVEWSIAYDERSTADAFKIIEKAGCKVVMATAEERNLTANTQNKFQIEFWMEGCKKAGVQDKAEALNKIWNEMYTQAKQAK